MHEDRRNFASASVSEVPAQAHRRTMTECKVQEFSLREEAKQSQAEQVFQRMARKGMIEPVRLGLYFKEVAKEMGVKVAETDIGRLLLEYGDLVRKGLDFRTLQVLQQAPPFLRLFSSSDCSTPDGPEGTNKLLALALDPPRSDRGSIPLPKPSQEYRLIELMFGTRFAIHGGVEKGNCALGGVEKLFNREQNAAFSARLEMPETVLSVSLLFFANTLELLDELSSGPAGFAPLYGRSPQDVIFSSDLSIAYHFFKRAACGTTNDGAKSVGPTARRWKSIIAGVILEKVWNERKCYALFVLNFEARARAIRDKGYSVIYFSKDNFYLVLTPEVCLPIYLLDFTFM